jgi:hypothetical protein
MSEGMFLGRKFAIPYDTTADKQAASIARAQLTTGTASPGAVIQVGDTVMAYGITPQQAKMGDLDVRLRSFEQISNQAQDVVRRNIQWQYGEQVGEIKKSWWRELIGTAHRDVSLKNLYPDSPGASERAAQAAATPTAQATTPTAPASNPTAQAATPTPQAKPKKAAPKKPAAAPAQTPAPAVATAPAPAGKAPKTKASPAAQTIAADQRMPARIEGHLITAFHNFSRRHKAARDGAQWEMSNERPDGFSFASVARHKASDAIERHEFRFDPDSNKVLHRFTAAGAKDHVETPIDLGEMNDSKGAPLKEWAPDNLHDYARSDNDKWVF